MKLLLDTHIFMWWHGSPKYLSQSALAALTDPTNILFLSVASIWEIQIKAQLGKLVVNQPLEDLIEQQKRVNNLHILPIEAAHVFALNGLPQHHKDPFDRLLIAQAVTENSTVISADHVFQSYPVNLIQ